MDLSVVALIVASASLIWSILSSMKHRETDAMGAANASLVTVEARFSEAPELLKFHGIENASEVLLEHGITAKEFAYLVNSFSVGGSLYRTTPARNLLLSEGSYRYRMCQSAATRRAWPLVRMLLTESHYKDALDKIVEDLNRAE